MMNWIAETHALGSAPKISDFQWMINVGVSARSIMTPWAVAVDEVIFDGYHFEFARDCDGEGNRAFTILCGDPLDAIDIVAWTPKANRMASWRGMAFALNQDEIFAPRLDADPIPIWRSPLFWLRSDRQGVVPLLQPPALRHRWNNLDHLPGLLVEDVGHGDEIARALPHFPRDKIFVRGKADGARLAS